MKLKTAVKAYTAAYNELADIVNDMDRREGYACLNIKIYSTWKWEQEIENYFKRNPTTPELQEMIRQEFNEDRINGLIDHVNQFEITYFKDWLNLLCHEADEKEVQMLRNFDHKDVYQFGRSGGWLSFARYADLARYQEDEYLAMSEFCQQYHPEQSRKQIIEAWEEICGYNLSQHEQLNKIAAELQWYTQRITDYTEAIKFVQDYVKRAKEEINTQYSEQLEYEIEEYLDTLNINIEQRIKRGYQHPEKIEAGMLYTSEGAAVPIDQIHRLIKAIEAGQEVTGQKAGPFLIKSHQEHEGKNYYQIGCHFMQFEEIKNFVNTAK